MPINPAVNFNSYTTVNVPVNENGGSMGCGCGCGSSSSGTTTAPPVYTTAGTLAGTPPSGVPTGSGAGGVPTTGDVFRSAGICIPLTASKPFGSDGFSFVNFDILADLTDKLTSSGLLNAGDTLVSARVNITGLAYIGLQVSVLGIALTPLPKNLTLTDTQGTVNTIFSSEETIGATLLKTGVGFTALHYDQKGLSLNLSGSAGLKLNGEMPAANRLLDPLDSPPSQYNPAWLKIEVCDAVVRPAGGFIGGGGTGSGYGGGYRAGDPAAPAGAGALLQTYHFTSWNSIAGSPGPTDSQTNNDEGTAVQTGPDHGGTARTTAFGYPAPSLTLSPGGGIRFYLGLAAGAGAHVYTTATKKIQFTWQTNNDVNPGDSFHIILAKNAAGAPVLFTNGQGILQTGTEPHTYTTVFTLAAPISDLLFIALNNDGSVNQAVDNVIIQLYAS